MEKLDSACQGKGYNFFVVLSIRCKNYFNCLDKTCFLLYTVKYGQFLIQWKYGNSSPCIWETVKRDNLHLAGQFPLVTDWGCRHKTATLQWVIFYYKDHGHGNCDLQGQHWFKSLFMNSEISTGAKLEKTVVKWGIQYICLYNTSIIKPSLGLKTMAVILGWSPYWAAM